MIISIIGSGNTATVLAKLFKQNNHSINEITGRNRSAVQELAEAVAAKPCFDIKALDKNSDVYIIAVKDDAVAAVSEQVNLNEKIVAHTCGSIAMNVLNKSSENFGVLYPLQSLRKELNYLPVIPFLIAGNNQFTTENMLNLAASVSESVIDVNDETRLQYHLSAIIISNFINHLFTLAKDYSRHNSIHFDLLAPLIEETVNRLGNHEPALIQTGPAIRRDEATMQKHLQLLHSFIPLKKVYEVMSESIQEYHRKYK